MIHLQDSHDEDDREFEKFPKHSVTGSWGSNVLAGKKQVFRRSDQEERYTEDIIGLKDESIEGGRPLLELVITDGKILRPPPSLQANQAKFKKSFTLLDDRYKSIKDHNAYPVKLSRRLEDLQKT